MCGFIQVSLFSSVHISRFCIFHTILPNHNANSVMRTESMCTVNVYISVLFLYVANKLAELI